MRSRSLCLFLLSLCLGAAAFPAQTWTADNGNWTYSNPLFYDEFADPDIIRVGPDFYVVGSSMHMMPGLAVLHSRDLVNWEFASYALDKLDQNPERLVPVLWYWAEAMIPQAGEGSGGRVLEGKPTAGKGTGDQRHRDSGASRFGEAGPRTFALEYGDLLAQGKDLQTKVMACAKERAQVSAQRALRVVPAAP